MALRWFLVLTLFSSLFLPVTAAKAQTLDQYGGYTSLPVPGGATGYFRVAKIGNRWVFATPDGNAFWMKGVFNVVPARNWTAKYSTSSQWASQTTKRLQAWGFNGFHISPNVHLLPNEQSIKFPYTFNLWSSYYGLRNSTGGLPGTPPGAFKDLIDGLNGTYTGWRGGSTPDVFDPAFDAYVNWRVQAHIADPGAFGSAIRSPWHLGFTTDDADQLWGLGGPGSLAPNGVRHAHIGWLTIATAPSRTSSAKYGVTYADPKVYSKYQLQADLRAKYGTIDALNAAWGSSYTTWDSAGGYGVGSGFLDEDGRDTAWLGDKNGFLDGAAPAVIADFDAFLYRVAKQYGTVLRTRLKQGLPNHLVLGPASVNGHFGLSRAPVLKALGETVDVVNASIGTQQILELTSQAMGDVPIVTWEGFIANPDSPLAAYPAPAMYPYSYSTQSARGQGYATKLTFLLSATNRAGVVPVIGLGLWDWSDSLAERTNWGLVTDRENAYDGIESVGPIGSDPWGYPTGGEAGNYGDFLSSVRAAHAGVASALGAGSGGPAALAVAVTAPQSGSTVRQSVTVSAAASSTASRVNLTLDGSIMAIVGGATASYPWDTTGSPNGTHTWIATAYDSSGNSASSTPASVTVQNSTGGGDTTPPVVAITQPLNGGAVARKSTVSITATASDNMGVTRVEFYLNGSLKCSDTTAPYTCVWQVPAVSGKTYQIQAKGYDAAGNVGSSSIVKVTAR